MGNSDSKLEGSTVGLHIVQVQGPAVAAGLQVYFDFITHIDGVRIQQSTIPKLLPSRPISLIIYSTKSNSLRSIYPLK
jgi:hypothetical protein